MTVCLHRFDQDFCCRNWKSQSCEEQDARSKTHNEATFNSYGPCGMVCLWGRCPGVVQLGLGATCQGLTGQGGPLWCRPPWGEILVTPQIVLHSPGYSVPSYIAFKVLKIVYFLLTCTHFGRLSPSHGCGEKCSLLVWKQGGDTEAHTQKMNRHRPEKHFYVARGDMLCLVLMVKRFIFPWCIAHTTMEVGYQLLFHVVSRFKQIFTFINFYQNTTLELVPVFIATAYITYLQMRRPEECGWKPWIWRETPKTLFVCSFHFRKNRILLSG